MYFTRFLGRRAALLVLLVAVGAGGIAMLAGPAAASPSTFVTSVSVPSDGTYGTGESLDFAVNFNANVTVDTSGGTPYITLTLNSGTVHASYLSGSGSSTLTFRYTIQSGDSDPDGIVVGGAITANGATLTDSSSANVDTTLNSVATTAAVLVDTTAPTVSTIDIAGTSPTNASSVQYTVTFDKPVNGVDATDFTVVGSGTASGSVSVVSGSGTTWTVTVGSVVGDGTLRLDLNAFGDPITDDYNNTLTASHTGDQSYTVQHTAPTASSMTVPADGTYGVNQNMDFTVTYTEPVTVDTSGGTPRLPITLDTGGTVYADYLSGSGASTLTFRFDPQSGEQDLTGIVTGTAIDTNGGTIRDAAGNDANLAINAVEPSTANVDVDAIPPTVQYVAVPANATYTAGQTLAFNVNFSRPVTVTGTPYIALTLATGGTVHASYVSGSGTSTLDFYYVVQPNQAAPAGVTVGSLSLNGGTIEDVYGNPATLTLNSVGSTSAVLIDSIPPTVSTIDLAGSSPTNAASVDYTVTFSEGVTGVSAAAFTPTTTGTLSYSAISVARVNAAVYTVTVSGLSGDGSMRLDLKSSGTGIADLASNPILTGYTAGQSYDIQRTPPQVTAMTVPASGNYTTGQALDFTVSFSKPVTVSGRPQIAITLASGTGAAIYDAGSGTNVLSFRYVPASGDSAPSGIALGSAISLAGATITDAVGNSAVLSLAGVEPSTSAIDVNLPAQTTTTTTTTTTPSAPPSNRLLSVHARFAANGTLTLTGSAPGPGAVNVLVTAWDNNTAHAAALLQPAKWRFAFARAHTVIARAGALHLLVAASRAGRRLIAGHPGKIRLRVWVTYTPTGGTLRQIGFAGLTLPRT